MTTEIQEEVVARLQTDVSRLQQDVSELFTRVDATEAAQAAINARQARIERLLGDLQVDSSQIKKILNIVAENTKR